MGPRRHRATRGAATTATSDSVGKGNIGKALKFKEAAATPLHTSQHNGCGVAVEERLEEGNLGT